MAPRVFFYTSVTPEKSGYVYGSNGGGTNARKGEPNCDLPGPFPPSSHSSPVVIPPKRGPQGRFSPVAGPRTPKRSHSLRRSPSASSGSRPLPSSVASVLEATAIPLPRRSRTTRESRRLPRGKVHPGDFSKMLMDGVGEDRLVEGTGNSMLDLLLSPPDENEKSPGYDCDMDTPSISSRSVSMDSTPSLDHDVESQSSLPASCSPLSQRSPLERKLRRVSLSEDCAFDHPLLDTSDSEWDTVDQESALAGTASPQTTSSGFGSTFKSNLTASLRAIKSAAQTVSAFATPSVQPDDFLTRSLFTIKPELTDDRRPPLMDEPPSPALRRYLNPIVVSPAEMHIYHESPHGAVDASRKCPVSIQMQTYRRSGTRSNRKRAFQLAGSGSRDHRRCCPFDPEISPMSRQREPRENSDFLRVVVLEMNMRRSGKLRDDIPPRARVWLPPRKSSQSRLSYSDYYEDDEEDDDAVPSRWIGITV